jgi:DNA-binding NtrC family response regulator
MGRRAIKILLVDDLSDWRKTISGVLEDEGFSVRAVSSTNEALHYLDNEIFDLALIDMRLEDTNEENIEGLRLSEYIKNHHPATKTIIISGYGTNEMVEKALRRDQSGYVIADDFILKSDVVELVPRITRLLESA